MYLGQLALIDSDQGDETAENAGAILGSYYNSTDPAYDHTYQLTADRLSEDADDTYDVDNGGGHDRFFVNGTGPYDFDAVAEYQITLTYIDGTTANITAYVFQDTTGHTFIAPETTYNADQAALTDKPIQSVSLNSVTSYTGDKDGDMIASRVNEPYAGPVDGTNGNDSMGVGYTDAQGHAITEDADVIYGYDGADTIDGGGGSDLIESGAGTDVVYGGAGNDTIYYGTGDDTIYGGDGNDLIDDEDLVRYTGSNEIHGGEGNDTVYSGDGSETIYGDGGDDSLSGEGGNDTLFGGTGNDVLWGGSGDDYLAGEDGNDWLIGESGNDTLIGGAGNDSLYGGTGNDSMLGGDGDDTFYYFAGDGLDTIADFGFGNTGSTTDGSSTNNDFIDLSSYYDAMNELRADFLDDGILNQSNAADYSNNTQFQPGDGIVFQGATTSDFTTDSTGVVCFTTGSQIRTPDGDRPIEELKVGDLVETLDGGPQPIKWIGTSHYDEAALIENPKLRPIVVSARVFGAERDLVVSRQHAFLLPEEDLLARAIQLVKMNVAGVRIAHGRKRVTYHHIMFEKHELIYSEGIATESMYPGPQALRALCPEAMESLLRVFPEFKGIETRECAEAAYGPTAREMIDMSNWRAEAAA
jgi:Ca2+-binding RTX toxin-like protein